MGPGSSADTDASEAPVTMIVNSSELRAVGFDLREVILLQLEAVARGDRRTRVVGSGHDVSEYELGASGLPPMFHHNNRGKIDETREK